MRRAVQFSGNSNVRSGSSPSLTSDVSCDVKSHQSLLSVDCFRLSPAFRSRYSMGAGVWRAAQATAKGLKPPKQCSQPGSLNPGMTVGSEGRVKLLNTRKHRHRKQATRGGSRLGPKWQVARFGLSDV